MRSLFLRINKNKNSIFTHTYILTHVFGTFFARNMTAFREKETNVSVFMKLFETLITMNPIGHN